MFIYMKKKTWFLNSFWRYYTLKIKYAIWLAEIILTRILPNKGLAVKCEQQYDFSFLIIFRKK